MSWWLFQSSTNTFNAETSRNVHNQNQDKLCLELMVTGQLHQLQEIVERFKLTPDDDQHCDIHRNQTTLQIDMARQGFHERRSTVIHSEIVGLHPRHEDEHGGVDQIGAEARIWGTVHGTACGGGQGEMLGRRRGQQRPHGGDKGDRRIHISGTRSSRAAQDRHSITEIDRDHHRQQMHQKLTRDRQIHRWGKDRGGRCMRRHIQQRFRLR